MTIENVIIFGEVLFDTFPDGSKTLGGAPFNVAWHLRAFGLDPLFISRVGNDAAGSKVRAAMQDWGMDTHGLQVDDCLPTGCVEVSFEDGEPGYSILHPVAFDAIEYQPGLFEGLAGTSLLYHGSLALRAPASNHALQQIRKYQQPAVTFVDVNLRPPWTQRETVQDCLREADWVKLNQYELEELGELGEKQSALSEAEEIRQQFGLSAMILTRGEQGAHLLTGKRVVHQVKPRQDTHVVDTVGAGDAFTSVMLVGLVNGWTTQVTLHRAQEFASQVCAQQGAIIGDRTFYQDVIDRWNAQPKTTG